MVVNVYALAEECVKLALTRYHLAPEAIVLEPHNKSDDLQVRGDPEALHTALMNLLGNAVKYSHGDVKARVSVKEDHGAWLRITVSDDGIGISKADLRRIFRRFYRVPSRAVLTTKGTGLGLFLVRQIARQHGGDAFAESAGEGMGATVGMQLPRLIGIPWRSEQSPREQARRKDR